MSFNVIIHGSSLLLSPQDVALPTPEPIEVNCFVVDPPFGKNFVSRRAVTPQGKKMADAIKGDGTLEEAFELFHQVMDVQLPSAAAECELYVFTSWDILAEWIGEVKKLDRHGFRFKMLLVWSKGYPGQGDIDSCWGCGHELILYLKKGRRDVNFRRSSIISVDKVPASQNIHETEKPAELIEKLLEVSTNEGDWIVDPFSGSGSTAVAAQRLNRNSIGFEINPKYIEPSRRRLEQKAFTF